MSDREIKRVGVLGAGTMGGGIAQCAAQAGCEVVVRDVSEEALASGIAAIDKSLSRLLKKERITVEQKAETLSRISTTLSMGEAAEGMDLIVEAIPERMDLKIEAFSFLGENAPGHAILGTNTSSLSVTEIAAASGCAERVVGMHFFNPVPVMKLLELVRGMNTGEETLRAARTFGERIGKECVVVNDWPGFATSRLGIILGCEAIRMVEQGVAEPADIDLAMELGYRHPMGPLKLTDLVGLDVRLAIMEHLFRELGEQFRPPTLLRQMVRAGKLGRKSGEGFYTYDG